MKNNEFKTMSNRQKIAYYRSIGRENLAENRKSIANVNEGKGVYKKQVKINSKNFQKLMKKRRLSSSVSLKLKKSFRKWDGNSSVISESQ